MLTRSPFHICARLYLPAFLLRVGLFTLMYMDSIIVLEKPVALNTKQGKPEQDSGLQLGPNSQYSTPQNSDRVLPQQYIFSLPR